MRYDDNYLADTIAEIKKMVTTLIVSNKGLKKRISELEEQLKYAQEERVKLDANLLKLQEDYDILKLAKKVGGDDEAKLQISKLVRDIDQCMLLIQNL